jgi:hypothetical protein
MGNDIKVRLAAGGGKLQRDHFSLLRTSDGDEALGEGWVASESDLESARPEHY